MSRNFPEGVGHKLLFVLHGHLAIGQRRAGFPARILMHERDVAKRDTRIKQRLG